MSKGTIQPTLIEGGEYEDARGKITFANAFDLLPVRRFYTIAPADMTVERAWQGHQLEAKYFFPVSGSFRVGLVAPDDWKIPSPDLPVMHFELHAEKAKVLHIPGGWINGFKALQPNSVLLVFSDFTINETTNDDYRYSADYWAL